MALVKVIPCNDETPETVRAPPIVANPVVERLVEETLAKDDCPEMFNVAPWRYPDAVRFVPLAFVKLRVGNKP